MQYFFKYEFQYPVEDKPNLPALVFKNHLKHDMISSPGLNKQEYLVYNRLYIAYTGTIVCIMAQMISLFIYALINVKNLF